MKFEYKTIEEKAAEWNVPAQNIQALCRKGKIPGIVKRGGVWFIPEDAQYPARKNKDSGLPFIFTGTKEKIFNSAIDLFMSKGFDNVGVKDIAGAVKIRQSAIYNHFKSKQEILDTVYGFFCHYYQAGRPSLEAMEEILRKGSVTDILAAIRYEFDESYKEKLFKATLILFQEKFINPQAREITKKYVLEDGISYVEAVLNRAIEIGRFPPFDVHAIAVLINAVRLYVMHAWIVDPSEEGKASLMQDDRTLYQYVVKFLTDLKPSV